VGKITLRRQHWKKSILALLCLFWAGNVLFFLLPSAWGNISAVSMRQNYRDWPSLESAYFHIRYSGDDRALAPLVAEEADRSAERVAAVIPYRQAPQKPWLVIVPDQNTMRHAFGWGEGTGALGVYTSNTITVLSPRSWDWEEENMRLFAFAGEGPLVHEITHYALDVRTGGNYLRWFSEGLAQLVEYNLLGSEWLEADSALNRLYSLDQLDGSFDYLDSQPLAYRQALSLVSYMEYLHGMEGINRLIDRLSKGTPFYKALHAEYGLDREAFLNGWQSWYSEDSRWFVTRRRK
jgi:hypothetical protein